MKGWKKYINLGKIREGMVGFWCYEMNCEYIRKQKNGLRVGPGANEASEGDISALI